MASLRPVPSVERRPGHRCRTRRLATGLVVAAVVPLLAAACAGEPPEVTNGDQELITGRAIYGASCASCHGIDGGGGVGGPLKDGAVVAAFPDIDEQIQLVVDGKDRMPAFVGRLDEDQVRAVVRYTRDVL